MMEYRRLGTSELKVSVVGLGGNTFGPPRATQEQSTKIIMKAKELGINLIDTAIGYGEGESERFIGNAIKEDRKHFIVATKFTLRNRKEGESVRDRILSQCDESLQKLQTDYIDLYQLHQPNASVSEEELLEPLAHLVEQGKIRYIGECNYGAWRHAITNLTAEKNSWPIMVSSQNHYNILHRHVELEVLPYCERFNVGFLPYFPLGGGFLTGKYQPGQAPPAGSRGAEGSGIIANTRNAKNEAILEKLEEMAHRNDHTVLDLAFGWLLAHEAVSSVIAGTMSESQVESNAAAGNWTLSPEELEEVNQLASWDGTGGAVDGASGGSRPTMGARAGIT
jgi:aryl-alcohol dehydrogenase-like predicted oxidoreductase